MLSKVIFTATIATNVSAGLLGTLSELGDSVSDQIDPVEDTVSD